jgi:hypothetical protein
LRRNATLLLVLVLLAGSAAAFAVAEHLKVEKSPVAAPDIDKVFSPVCNCPQRHAKIGFRLRRSDRLTLSLLDRDGHEIRRLVDHVPMRRGRHAFFWNGRDKDGRLVPEGKYRPKVELGNADRTIVLPNPIRVDVTRPVVRVVSIRPRVISPDGDGRNDVARVRYRSNERARVTLLVDGARRVTSRGEKPAGQVEWLALGVVPGSYDLSLEAQDLAGNVSAPASGGPVEVRYIELRAAPPTAPRGRVRIHADTDAKSVHWLLRKGSSVVASGTGGRTIRFRAPAKPGRYLLVAAAGSHQGRTTLVVATP